jgi:hypothetical protein
MEVPNQKITRQVSPQWDWLMREISAEQLAFGEARVIFHNGEPVEIVELLRRKRFN